MYCGALSVNGIYKISRAQRVGDYSLPLVGDVAIDTLDIRNDFGFAQSFLGRCDEDRGQFCPRLQKFLLVTLYVSCEFAFTQFVCFGKDDGERNLVLAQPLHKLQVNLLWFVATVHQYEQTHQRFAQQAVALNHHLELGALLLARLCKTITGQIHQMPMRVGACIDEEVVDEQGFAWLLTGLRQFGIMREHIDETGLTHIASTNESVLRDSRLRTLHHVRTGNNKGCRSNHIYGCWLCNFCLSIEEQRQTYR